MAGSKVVVSGVLENVTWFVPDPIVTALLSLPLPSKIPSSKSAANASMIESISSIERVPPFLCLFAKWENPVRIVRNFADIGLFGFSNSMIMSSSSGYASSDRLLADMLSLENDFGVVEESVSPLLSPNHITISLLAFLYSAFGSAPTPACRIKDWSRFPNILEKGDSIVFLRLFPISLLSGRIVTKLKLEFGATNTSAFDFSSNTVVFPLGSPDTLTHIVPPVLSYVNE